MNAQPSALSPSTQPKADVALECRLRKVIDGGPAAIDERLAQLESEWTAGRAAKATAGVMLVGGLALSAGLNPWWLVLTAAGGVILLPYLFGRRSPAGRLFHAMGLRTGTEIEREKTALKALRGDFQGVPALHQIEDREDITRLEGEGGIVVERDETKVDPHDAVREVIGATRR